MFCKVHAVPYFTKAVNLPSDLQRRAATSVQYKHQLTFETHTTGIRNRAHQLLDQTKHCTHEDRTVRPHAPFLRKIFYSRHNIT